ncbi:CdaR family transcriptional regulator [Lederbergia wuyishanensis]|uniref:Carbohydrate diacid regulator n=1 Tax=Lederbergia wuyishanensis TaxID=1347903 RepID=A0ABU0DA00_9BACI|nr:sugar diacid recognition domain-containing protein [Lederbergia wuyishanensis]MCJ8008449.1 helix-turn-helix domain-containing protein [Lederbergia wuyishanensis]MDQ0345192.1 carbohydrate diacid regulator [Lederbergia wuyishanensis]
MITREIAEMLVKETSNVLDLNINVMNEKGIILASGDSSRLYAIHEGALEVIRSGQIVEITEKNKNKLRGTKAGINLPINLQNQIVGVIGITGNPKSIGNRAGLVKMMAELMIKQTYLATQAEWKQRMKEMAIEEFLKDYPNFNNVKRWLGLLNIQLEGPFVIALIIISDHSFSRQSLITSTENFIGKGNGIAGLIHVNKMMLILKEDTLSQAKKKFSKLYQHLNSINTNIKLGYSSIIPDWNCIRNAYRECEIALAISDAETNIISYTDIEPKALIHQIDRKIAGAFYNRIILGSIETHQETLQAFFDCNFNIKETAEKLFIHRNTLIYRLNKIKEESGYDPQNFKDAFALQMGIWLKNIHEQYTEREEKQ